MSQKKLLDYLDRTGLSTPEQEVSFITDEPKIPYFVALPSDFADKKYSTKDCYGQGYHPDSILARIKAKAELLERLCLDNPQTSKLISSKYIQNNNFIDPGVFCCYSERQIGDQESFKQNCRNNTYSWFEVDDFLNQKKVMLPAQLIFISRLFDHEFEIRKERISTGAAFGKKGTGQAFQSGLLETIERDSCIHAYLTKRKCSRIVGLKGKLKDLENYMKRYNLEPFIFDVTSDLGIPTALTVVIDRTGIGPAVEVGSATSFSYDEAIYKSMLESIQCRRYSRLFTDQRFPNGPPNENEIFSLDNRFVYWHPIDRIKDIAFWIDSDKIIEHSDIPSNVCNFETALKRLKEKNFNLFFADITLPELECNGLEVVKAIIPELHPLYLDERAKSLFSTHYGEIKDDKTLKPHPLT